MGGFAAAPLGRRPGALIANTYTVPIALLAMVFGLRAGLAAAAFALLLVWAWGEFKQRRARACSATRRAAASSSSSPCSSATTRSGSSATSRSAGGRRPSSRSARDDLDVSNAELTLAVTRLEAFAEIARAVGGETELRTVLDRILEHGRAIVGARALVAYLEQNGELVARGRPTDRRQGCPTRARSTEELIESVLAAGEPTLAVRLRWQGETLGALAAGRPLEGGAFDEEAEELMGSVAASAATAVATAKSVAADRLRHEIQASEEARARWARELHDETLQGLVGLRMLLASARRSGSPDHVEAGRLGRARADAARDREPPQPDRRAPPGGARRAADSTRPSRRSRSGAARRPGLEVETQIDLRNGGTRAPGARHRDHGLPARPGGAQQRRPSLGRLAHPCRGGRARRRGRRHASPTTATGSTPRRPAAASACAGCASASSSPAAGCRSTPRLTAARCGPGCPPAGHSGTPATFAGCKCLTTCRRGAPWPTDFSKSFRRSSP